MHWWQRLFSRKSQWSLVGQEYRIAFTLYSADAKREAEVREFRNKQVYLVERERIEGTTFRDRHPRTMVGPFPSPEEAEKFIVTTAWFNGRDA